ncbi:hypothetical protein IMSHALPRED_003953 [Imshaugia aleurites]|uniref:F-box domain-containing protein n=1 Tax=Imshaugia aleurites TaxID=172621 RepID=A0A8H3I726_9LECA|nr:hypothetical protein IMSHALPRED_003953 [Imshaugia aleurites]
MPSLLDFSNETLYHIIEKISPSDILNFALCCSDLHRLAQKTLEMHGSWKQAYTSVVLRGCHRHPKRSHPLQLIRDICMDWRVGEFPKVLKVECCDKYEYNDGESDNEEQHEESRIWRGEDSRTVTKLMAGIDGDIKDMALAPGFLPSSEVDDLCSLIRSGHKDAMIGLLLLLLPNLESICFEGYSWKADELSKIVAAIASPDLRGRPGSKLLTKLSQIEVDTFSSFRGGENLALLTQFAALPSMRTLVGSHVKAFHNDPEIWRFGSRTSNVTEIIFQNISRVTVALLRRILSGINALKRFTYDHFVGSHADSPMKAHRIIGALLEHAKDSLEYLALTGDSNTHDVEEDNHSNNGSLQGFTVLKDVVLPSEIYVDRAPYECEFPPDADMYGRRPQDAVRDIVDILPPSIETVKLDGGYQLRYIGKQLANLPDEMDLRFPELNKITILTKSYYGVSRVWTECLTKAYDRKGMKLEVVEEN